MREKLDYIYYRFYRFQIAVGNATVAVPFAFLFMLFLILTNLFSISYILYGLFGLELLARNGIIKTFSISILLLFLNFFLFIYRKRYKKIIKTYQKDTKHEIRRGNLLVILYVVFTFILIGVGFYLMILRNNE